MITIIAAMDKNGLIGKDSGIPWKIPADMIRFKEQTTGNTVVMGRKTYESIPPHVRPLPNRNNIVLTSQSDYQETGIEICRTTDGLIDAVFNNPIYPNIFIAGGASLYNFSISFADKLELTFVDGEYEGDTFFPTFYQIGDKLTFNQHNAFTRINQENHDGFSFQTFERA